MWFQIVFHVAKNKILGQILDFLNGFGMKKVNFKDIEHQHNIIVGSVKLTTAVFGIGL